MTTRDLMFGAYRVDRVSPTRWQDPTKQRGTPMKTFSLSFECDNDVFADYPADAIADALLAVSKQVRQHWACPAAYANDPQWIRDNNGNRIGTYKYEVRDRVTLVRGR